MVEVWFLGLGLTLSLLLTLALEVGLIPSLLPSFLRALPLEVGPLNPARGSGERFKLRHWGLGQPQPKSNLVHFGFKI